MERMTKRTPYAVDVTGGGRNSAIMRRMSAKRVLGMATSANEPIKDWSLTSLKEKLIKIGAKVISPGRYVAFQMADVAIPRTLFADLLRMIAELRSPPVTSTA